MTDDSNNNGFIKILDALIQQQGAHMEMEELYSITLGIAVYRLQSLIGAENTHQLLLGVIEGLNEIPKPNRNKMN